MCINIFISHNCILRYYIIYVTTIKRIKSVIGLRHVTICCYKTDYAHNFKPIVLRVKVTSQQTICRDK